MAVNDSKKYLEHAWTALLVPIFESSLDNSLGWWCNSVDIIAFGVAVFRLSEFVFVFVVQMYNEHLCNNNKDCFVVVVEAPG